MKYLMLTTLLACANLDREQCQKTNWVEKGLKDGSKGNRDPSEDAYALQCTEFGILVNKQAYLKGYGEGLRRFCNYNSGFVMGLEGNGRHIRCESMSVSFKRGYLKGYKEFTDNRKKKVD